MRHTNVCPTATTSTAKQETANQDYNTKNRSTHAIIMAGCFFTVNILTAYIEASGWCSFTPEVVESLLSGHCVVDQDHFTLLDRKS